MTSTFSQPAATSSQGSARVLRDHIFDFGMNNGDDTAFYLRQGYNVVAVEADPILVENGKRRFATEIAAGKLRILNVGLSEKDGSGEFWICDKKPQFNSFLKESASRDSLEHHSITVQTLRPASLFEQYGIPYYLKIDIEGYEELCLSDLGRFDLPRFISVECHHFEGHGEQGLLLVEQLKTLGYRRFKLINQFTFCAMPRRPNVAIVMDSIARRVLTQSPLNKITGSYWLARKLVVRLQLQHKFGWQFPVGSSGVWGEHTNGKWLSYDGARQLYSHYQRIYRQDAGNSFWCDWHAAL